MLAACSEASDTEESRFLGTWGREDGGFRIVFATDGTSVQYVDGPTNYPTSEDPDGKLSLHAPHLGEAEFSLSEDANTLYGLGEEFKRLSGACQLTDDGEMLLCKAGFPT